jgi:hypothetical protein
MCILFPPSVEIFLSKFIFRYFAVEPATFLFF